MATAFDTPVAPFAGPFADLSTQFLEASTRTISASAELYTQVLTSQAAATRSLLEAFSGVGAQAVATGAEATEQAAEKTTRAARSTARTTARATRSTARTANRATRRGADATRRAAKPVTRAAKAAAQPPVTGYDDLTAEEIVAKLPEQPQTVLAQIAVYEKAKENRATVLQRVAALTGPEPAPGYDELTADDAQKLVADGNADLAGAVRDYERRHKDRATVIEAAARHADAS
jgi:hypothetical protein